MSMITFQEEQSIQIQKVIQYYQHMNISLIQIVILLKKQLMERQILIHIMKTMNLLHHLNISITKLFRQHISMMSLEIK